MKECKCPDWEFNIKIIDEMILIQSSMSWGNPKGYEGKLFEFCPWCGTRLVLIKKEEIEEKQFPDISKILTYVKECKEE